MLMLSDRQIKFIRLAIEICRMHAETAGNRTCQDWSGDPDILNLLDSDDWNAAMFLYEQSNSQGRDFVDGQIPTDEMIISYVAAKMLELIIAED